MNKEDIAFYKSGLVMRVARSFIKNRSWDSLSARSQKKYLEQAIDAVWLVLNQDRI